METELTRTAHPAVHLAVGAWHARRSRRLVASVEALLPDVAAAVEHVTGQPLPLTVVHINSPAVSAVTVETGAHRSHIGPQPLPRILTQIARSWWELLLNQALTVRYSHPTVQLFLNPVLLRRVDEDELIRILGHELVHGVQLAHPTSTGYGTDIANNYRIARYTPLQAAEANATVALHEAAAYRLEARIVEATDWSRRGLLGSPLLDVDVDPLRPVEDLIRDVDALTSRPLPYEPLRMLEELRDAAPAAAIADLVDYLAGALGEQGRTLVADPLTKAGVLLTEASALLTESVEHHPDLYLRSLGSDPMFEFRSADALAIEDADPVSLVPALAVVQQAGAR